MVALIIVYLLALCLCAAFLLGIINPVSKEEWGQWAVCTILWPLAILIFVLSHLGSTMHLILPSREVVMSRKQQKEILFLKEKNRLAKEALDTQREYEELIVKSGYERQR